MKKKIIVEHSCEKSCLVNGPKDRKEEKFRENA